MCNLLESGDGDTEIYVKHRTFHAHSHILCGRSPYIKGMLASSMREAESKEITDTLMDPETFEVLLTFIYTDTVDDAALEAMAEELLKVGDTYAHACTRTPWHI